ncbi:hypothetical protein JL720_3782 [Aureococcus anophagefferens]|nr:hypothetical protein JL720_3782 [Aureococcus anophagefferens]
MPRRPRPVAGGADRSRPARRRPSRRRSSRRPRRSTSPTRSRTRRRYRRRRRGAVVGATTTTAGFAAGGGDTGKEDPCKKKKLEKKKKCLKFEKKGQTLCQWDETNKCHSKTCGSNAEKKPCKKAGGCEWKKGQCVASSGVSCKKQKKEKKCTKAGCAWDAKKEKCADSSGVSCKKQKKEKKCTKAGCAWDAKKEKHECALADWAAAGARRVVVSLRDPVSRLVSGFQRRMEGGAPTAANRAFAREFPRLDAYVDALFAPADPRHALALEITYPDKNQNFLVPVEEFYLASLDRGAPRDAREVAVDVRYACIESLDDDVAAILGAWGRAPNANARKNATKHRSRNASDAPTTRHRLISDGNAARVEALYAADAALHARHCSADRGREPGGGTFRYRTPR